MLSKDVQHIVYHLRLSQSAPWRRGTQLQAMRELEVYNSWSEPGRAGPGRDAAVLTDGDGGHDQRVAVEQSRGLGRQVSAEVLQEKVFLGLLLAAAFGSHGEPICAGCAAGEIGMTRSGRSASEED